MRRWLAAALGVVAVVLAVNARLLAGTVAPKWDADDFFAPFFTLVADHARAGRLLLWDPWIAGGEPDFADPQVGAFSPITVLVGAAVGGSEVGFRAYWLLLWLAGPLGLLVLGRTLGAPAWGGFVVGTGFALSGFYTGHAEHTSLLYPIALLPLVLWRLDVAFGTRRLRPAVEAGALWGLSSLAAYPLMAVLNGFFAGFWALGRWLWPADEGIAIEDVPTRRAERVGAGALLGVAGAAVLTGLVILAPPYVALLTETVGYSDRTGQVSREVAVGKNPLHPGALATAASPYLALLKLHRTNPTLWAPTDVSTVSVYLGAPVTLLAVFALVARPRARWRWWLAGTGLFFLAAALGPALPVRGWLYDLVPPMRYFRHPGFFRVYALVAAAVLALYATRDLEVARCPPRSGLWQRLLGTALVAGAIALAVGGAVLFLVPNRGEAAGRAGVHAALVWAGLGAVAWLAWRAKPAVRRRMLPVALGTLAVLDAILTMSLAWPLVHEPGPSRRVWDRINAVRITHLDLTPSGLWRDQRPPAWVGEYTNKNVPLRIPTLENFVALGNRFHRDVAARPSLAAIALGTERLWFAREVATTAPTDAAFAAFAARSEALRAPVLVLHARGDMRRIGVPGPAADDAMAGGLIARLPGAARVPATVARYTTGELHLTLTAPDRGWLLVTDRWAPGWQATVNGTPTDVLGGSFLFRAVALGPGPADIRFTYHPAGWAALLLLSWGTLLAVLMTAIAAATHRPRHDTGANGR